MAAPSTGINRWWTYQEKPLAGVGKAMVNVANGNLLVQSDDVDIHERGIDLAFRRTYNSQSQHDSAGTDGSTPSVFGNGWTNTFDAHMAYNAAWNVLSVYDIDGARYDYTANGSGGWNPPSGMQGTTLAWDGCNGYFWTKKTGTTYYFWQPTSGCTLSASNAAYEGRLYEIIGRNNLNYIRFTYGWVAGNASSSQNLATITATHSDGQALTLTFAKFGSNTELASITRPDGKTITYSYDTSGDLVAVSRPGNATDDATRTASITALQEQYWYYTGTHEMQCVAGPRYVWSAANTPSNLDGGYYGFVYSANTTSGQLNQINDYGVLNFTPNDGTGVPLQSSVTTALAMWRQMEFYYYPNNAGFADVTRMVDTDGHSSQWAADASNRVVETWDWQASLWLVTYASWDANNDLTASVDPRGNQTNYTYDANGNTLSIQKPSISTSMGTGNPTAYYSYDQYNNMISYCDPNYVWTTHVTSCGAVPGATYYVYNYSDTNEPYGMVVNAYAPIGYGTTFGYYSNLQSDNYGLPTSVTGASYTQNDGTVRTPTQTFAYDAYGNLTSYNKGNGAWTLTYDALNRNITRQDPDGVTSYTCYNPDGSVPLQRSASEYAADSGAACGSIAPANSAGISYVFDTDGNTLTEQHHHGCATLSACQAGVTTKWYDGQDQLVEVRQPQDGSDTYAFPWMTRYIYDISGGGTQNITGGASGFLAYGNLFKTQECVQATSVQVSGPTTNPTSPTAPLNTPSAPVYTGGCSFEDQRGNTFDALDRSLTKNEVAAGTTPEQTTAYDCNGEYGLTCTKTNPLNQLDTLTYDADGNLASETFTDGVTPNRSYAYDPDGHETSLSSSTLGTQTRLYDADGRVTTATDPSNEQDPGTITYAYYGDGLRSSLGLSIPGLSFSQSGLFEYSYRPDGLRSSLVDALGAASGTGSGTFAWTYTGAGRALTQSDPFTGLVASGTSQTLVAKTLTYDAYGRVASLQLPRGTNQFGSYTYDLDDATQTYNVAGMQNGYEYYQYSTRNEVPGMHAAGASYANGAVCTTLTASCTYDTRSGQMISQQDSSTVGSQQVIAQHTYTYDGAGRETGDLESCSNIQATRSYDADNHIIGQNIPSLFTPDNCSDSNYPAGQALTYSWDASGHLANFSSNTFANNSTANYSAHWDGSDLLYAVNSGYLDVYVEKLAYSSNASGGGVWGMVVFDRDQSGTNVNLHYSLGAALYGFGVLSLENVKPFMPPRSCAASGPQGMTIECGGSTFPQPLSAGGASTGTSAINVPGAPLDAKREDGYFDGTIAIQGVRAYDPNMNQWTSPDAYAGDVHDPMSQHPYMWNDNNPVQYSDPSGYMFVFPLGEGPTALDVLKGVIDFVRVATGQAVEKNVTEKEADFYNQRLDKVRNNISNHLTESDLRGAATQKATGIEQGGDHLKEVNQAIQGLKNQVQAIDRYLADHKSVSADMKSSLDALKVQTQQAISAAESAIQ